MNPWKNHRRYNDIWTDHASQSLKNPQRRRWVTADEEVSWQPSNQDAMAHNMTPDYAVFQGRDRLPIDREYCIAKPPFEFHAPFDSGKGKPRSLQYISIF